MSFEQVAALLLPADDGDVAVLRAGDAWRLEVPRDAATVIWGREQTWMPAGPRLLRYALERERALLRFRGRPPPSWTVIGVHRWLYSFYKARHVPATMSRLRGGAIVELAREPGRERVLDTAARAAGASARVGPLHLGAGGHISARAELEGGREGVLRVARVGSPGDPSRPSGALRRLAPLELACVPRLIRQGCEASASWTVETLLPGRQPPGISPALVDAVTDLCLQLPCEPSAPRAFAADVAGLVRQLPAFADQLRELQARAAPALAGLPSVLRHGDLWQGNLLVQRGQLSGVVDWDAWHPSGVPGTDLLQLVASARALASQRSFAEVLVQRPWDDALLAGPAARYWAELGIAPTREVLDAITVACWAGQTMETLNRHPGTAEDPLWLERNVAPLLGRA